MQMRDDRSNYKQEVRKLVMRQAVRSKTTVIILCNTIIKLLNSVYGIGLIMITILTSGRPKRMDRRLNVDKYSLC